MNCLCVTCLQLGNYNVESLLEMIALHLDATYGLAGTWGELASCFLGLQTILNSGYEEDCMSTVQHTNDTVGKPACSTSFNLIHPMFMKSEVRKSWRLRCRWWSSRHFSKDKYLSEVQAGKFLGCSISHVNCIKLLEELMLSIHVIKHSKFIHVEYML